MFSSQWRCESSSGTPLLRRLDPPRDNRPCDATASSTGRWPLTVLTVRRSTVGELRRRPLVAAVHGESAAARRAKSHMTYARIPPDTLTNCQPRTVMCRLRETPYGLVNAGPLSPRRGLRTVTPPRAKDSTAACVVGIERRGACAAGAVDRRGFLPVGGLCDPMPHTCPPCTDIPAPRLPRRGLRAAADDGCT